MSNVSPSETCYDYFGSFLTNCGELLNRKYKLYRLTEKINSNGIFFIEESKIVHVFGLGSNVFGNTLFNNFLDDEKVTSDNIVSFVELIWLAFNPVDLKNQDLNPDSVLNAIDLNQLYKKLEEIESFNFYSASTFGIEGMKRFASNTELSKKVFEEAFLKFKKDNQNPELLRDIVDKVLEKACYHNSPGIPLLSFFNFLGFSANIQAKVAFDYCGIKKSDFVNMIELGLKKNLLPFALKHKVLLSSEHSCHSSVIDETVFPLYYGTVASQIIF